VVGNPCYSRFVPGPLSWWELAILLLLLLLIFGPKRLPEMGRSLGRGIREFKESITSSAKDDEPDEPAEPPAELPAAEEEPVTATRSRRKSAT
jgi:sec-independent protein translocase protein TatA